MTDADTSPADRDSAPNPDEVALPKCFADDLLAWYRVQRRDLPWRAGYDPYAVWVSEIMLQQTQVATVIPYFERFLARFPTLADLATAPEEELMRHWAGLGYYTRARNLQRGAKEVLERFQGRVPSRVEELLTLPGVGRYTAGAIASIAHNVSAPILDGNVMRVLCRVFALSGDPRRNPLNRRLWALAEAMIPERHARDFNSALMELGAMVCAPKSPRCGSCPVSRHCQAFREGAQSRYPQLVARPASTEEHRVCAVAVREDGRVLLIQPTEAGRWAGLWQIPHAALAPETPGADRLADLLAEYGLSASAFCPVITVRHGITRYRITLQAYECRVTGEVATDLPTRWASGEELAELPLPAPHRRVAAAWLSGVRPDHADGRQLALPITVEEGR